MSAAQLEITIGNRNYSSWSLRGWLALEQTGAPYREVVIPLYTETADAAKRERSPSGKVPALRDLEQDVTVWDSLGIALHLADRFPDAGLWPAEPRARALARCAVAEMHSGFPALRAERPMNIRADRPGLPSTPALEADIARVQALWRACRAAARDRGPFLLGEWSLADAFFAPVVFRFASYHPTLDETARAYCAAVRAHEPVARWEAAARAEVWTIPQYDL